MAGALLCSEPGASASKTGGSPQAQQPAAQQARLAEDKPRDPLSTESVACRSVDEERTSVRRTQSLEIHGRSLPEPSGGQKSPIDEPSER